MAASSSIFSSEQARHLPWRAVVLFIAALIVLDQGVGRLVESFILGTDSNWGPNQVARLIQRREPGIILGNSRAGAIAPKILRARTGFAFFNGTAPGQSIRYQIVVFEELLRRNPGLKIVIYELDHLFCPWKPKQRVDPEVSTTVYGETVYFCCAECRDNARQFVAIQTNEFGFFGVRIEIDQVRARQNLDNFAVVIEVIRDSPAARLGVEKGSIIRKIGGEEMNDYRKVIKWMRLSKPGEEALYEIETPDGQTREMKVVLGERGAHRGGLVN